MIRRFGEPPQKNQTYRARPGVYALLPRNSHLLLTHQLQPEPDLQLPGGGVDPGESPLQTLHREVMEETGWKIAAPKRLGCFRRFVFMPEYDLWAEKICHIYTARPARPVCAPLEPHHQTVWLPVEEASEMLGNAGDRHFARVLAGLE